MSAQLTAPNSEAAILSRLIEKQDQELSPAAAEYLLTIRFEQQDIVRMNELSELARQGALKSQEQIELDSYIYVNNLLGTMQSRARRVLWHLSK